MMMQEEFKDRANLSINDIDLSLLRLSSPPTYDSFFFSPVSPPPDISPLKRSSPVSDESDHPKRRRLSSQDPIFITSPLRSSTYHEPHSSSTIEDPTTHYPNLAAGHILCSHLSSVSEKQETTLSASKTPDKEVACYIIKKHFSSLMWFF